MGQPGNKFRIELDEKEALAGLLKVKPTKDMPKRPTKKKIDIKKNSPSVGG
jgi:hypothetical protein